MKMIQMKMIPVDVRSVVEILNVLKHHENGTGGVLNRENVAVDVTKNDHGEGELSGSCSDEFNSVMCGFNVGRNSQAEQKLPSYQTYCNENYDSLNYHV